MTAQDPALTRMKTMCSGLAHELNNYTGALQGYLQLLQLDPHGPESQEYLQLMLQLCGKVQGMTRGLQDFASLKPQGAITTVLEDLIRSELESRGLDYQNDASQALVYVEPFGFRQALKELLDYAEALCGREGIRVGLRQEEGHLVLSVLARGVQADTAALDRVFDPYSGALGGKRGLALARAHGIVVRQGAEIEVRLAEGSGVLFEISFSILESELESPQEVN